MKTVTNQLIPSMKTSLKQQIGSTFLSYDCEFIEDSSSIVQCGIKLNFENKSLYLLCDLEYFDFLGGDDFSFIKVFDQNNSDFDKYKQKNKWKNISVNKKIIDIQIVTESFHCQNIDEDIDENFICDFGIVFVFEDSKLLFEKSNNSLEFIDIKSFSTNENISFYDNSKEFYGEKEFSEDDFLYHTFRDRRIFSLYYNKEI